MNINNFYKLFGIKQEGGNFLLEEVNINCHIRQIQELYYSLSRDRLKVNGRDYFGLSILNKIIPEVLNIIQKIKIQELQHFKDTNIGLWATDKEPIDKANFWQIKE